MQRDDCDDLYALCAGGGGQGLLSRALFIVCLLMIVFFPFLSVPVLFDVGYVHFIV